MRLVCKPLMNGIMAFWEEVPEAARYNVYLYVNDQRIYTKVNERTELYYSFLGLAAIDGVTNSKLGSVAHAASLAGYNGIRPTSKPPQHSGFDYYVQVEAENRNGEIVEVSEKIRSTVKEF